MPTSLGSGDYVYEEVVDWAKLPDGWTFQDAPDVVVDAQDRVYVFNRGEHPMVVFEPDGTFITSWGEGFFVRPHGVTLGPDGALYCVDDGAHCIYKCSLDGQVLATIGTPGQPAPRLSGKPFNQPTKVAFHPRSGNLYIADGYGNGRVHVFSPAGECLFSWGSHGSDPGQFNLVHSIAMDGKGRVYIADRENHRVQVFDDQGNYLEQWNNLHRPCGLHIDGETAYGQLLTHLSVNADYPNLGACVTIHDLSGRRLARLGDAFAGEGPGQFTTPHGLAVDSRGDVYVGEVAWNAYGSRLDPPRMARCFRKLVKVSR
jgi:DNA-binding beta-propeller fold protein YncE